MHYQTVELEVTESLAAAGARTPKPPEAMTEKRTLDMTSIDDLRMAWHASDCRGVCDGCGYIADDGLWYPGPCPDRFAESQERWAEAGV